VAEGQRDVRLGGVEKVEQPLGDVGQVGPRRGEVRPDAGLGELQQRHLAVVVPHLDKPGGPQLDQPAEPGVVVETLRLATPGHADVVEHPVAGRQGLVPGDPQDVVGGRQGVGGTARGLASFRCTAKDYHRPPAGGYSDPDGGSVG